MKKLSDRGANVLLVDDEEKFLNPISQRLNLLGFEVLKASSGHEALAIAADNHIAIAVVDLKMPEMDGLVTIAKLKERQPDLQTVLLTGHGNEKIKQATESLNSSYFEKDEMTRFWKFIQHFHKDGNVIVIRPPAGSAPTDSNIGPARVFGSENQGVLQDYQASQINASQAGPDDPEQNPFAAGPSRMIGETHAIQQLKKNIKRFAALDCPVTIYGETGVGKELAARAIHDLSPRGAQRFMAINCGAFSNDLLIEELFGNEEASVASSDPAEGGLFAANSRGTLLLDQIEELSPRMQLSILKVIDRNKAAQRISHINPFDIRIMAASRSDLGKQVEAGKFRQELYFRLNVAELSIPPLRERRDDIAPLCSYFLTRYAREFNKPVETISDEVISLFMSYDFPGNVRELEHAVERAVILAEGRKLELRHFPDRFQTADPPPRPNQSEFKTLAEIEKEYILETLGALEGNKSKTAEVLGISRAALWRKLKQFKAEAKG